MFLSDEHAGVAGTFDVVSPLRLRCRWHEPIAAGASWLPYAEKVARKGLSDRYPRKNQTFRQMPNSFPRPPTLATRGLPRAVSADRQLWRRRCN